MARSRPQRRQVRPETRRAELLAAGAEQLAGLGPDRLTVAAVADAAGTAVGNVYRYFESKDALIAAVRDDVVSQMLEVVASVPAANSADGWWKAAKSTVAASVEFWFANPPLHRVVLGADAASTSALSSAEADIITAVVDGLRAGRRLGAVRCEYPEVIASTVVHGLFGVVYHALTENQYDQEAVVDGVMELLGGLDPR